MFNKDLEEIKKSQSIMNNAITEVKSTMRYHLMPVGMAAIKKSTNNKCWERVWRKRNPLTLLVTMQTNIATMENSVVIP